MEVRNSILKANSDIRHFVIAVYFINNFYFINSLHYSINCNGTLLVFHVMEFYQLLIVNIELHFILFLLVL